MLIQKLALSVPLCAKSPSIHDDVRPDRQMRGCTLGGERKYWGKVGNHSSAAIKVLGNLKGAVEERCRGMELEPPPLGEICSLVCTYRPCVSRWMRTVSLPSTRLASDLTPGHQYTSFIQQQPLGPGAHGEPKSKRCKWKDPTSFSLPARGNRYSKVH